MCGRAGKEADTRVPRVSDRGREGEVRARVERAVRALKGFGPALDSAQLLFEGFLLIS